MGTIHAICISEKRGTKKVQIPKANLIKNFGIENDAHAGNWHRQISLLPLEKIQAFRERGANVSYGDFGENIVVEGIDFSLLDKGAIIECAESGVILRLTQKGKECHAHCEIYRQMGDCIMPREGVFAEVVSGGEIKLGDKLVVRKPKAAVITVSDKGYRGEREDESGPVLSAALLNAGYQVVESVIVPDEKELIEKELIRLCDTAVLVLTTGGTGFSQRDVTPEATLAVADKNAPGISEAIRAYSMSITPRAMLSRAVSVIKGKSLIINIPGSPKAAKECAEYVMPYLTHGLNILNGGESECATQ